MWNYVAVALGGIVGCCARYGVSQAVQVYYGKSFPLATLIINVSGCLAMGFLFYLTLERVSISPSMRVALLTGVLGGYTTFSTFAMEALVLAEDGELRTALLYITLSVVLGIGAAFLGAYWARSI
ncbi:MAG TPA: fluoride efflux transporter CrcB [Gammaproteobacteria bacterium]|nr:fluoride efflux transporter CrcB [Gammaproteobacteria bacterium]